MRDLRAILEELDRIWRERRDIDARLIGYAEGATAALEWVRGKDRPPTTELRERTEQLKRDARVERRRSCLRCGLQSAWSDGRCLGCGHPTGTPYP